MESERRAFKWGLRKRFLNEVHHRLKDMAHAFEVLAERPSPTASASKDVGAHPSFAASNTTSSSSSPSVAAPQRSDSPRTRKTFAANTDVGKRADDLPFHIVGRDNKRRDKLKRPSGLSIMPPRRRGPRPSAFSGVVKREGKGRCSFD